MYNYFPANSNIGSIITALDAHFTAMGMAPSIDGSAVRTVSLGSGKTFTYHAYLTLSVWRVYMFGSTAYRTDYPVYISSSASLKQLTISFPSSATATTLTVFAGRLTCQGQNSSPASYAPATLSSPYTSMPSGEIFTRFTSDGKAVQLLPAALIAANAAAVATFESNYNAKVVSTESYTAASTLNTVFTTATGTQNSSPMGSVSTVGYNPVFNFLTPRPYTYVIGDTLWSDMSILYCDYSNAGLSYGDSITLGGYTYRASAWGCLTRED